MSTPTSPGATQATKDPATGRVQLWTLALIAVMSTLMAATVMIYAHSGRDLETITDKTGFQRALAREILLDAGRLVQADTAEQRMAARSAMAAAMEQMRTDLEILVANARERQGQSRTLAALAAYYGDGRTGLVADVNRYLAQAGLLLSRPASELSAASDDYRTLGALASPAFFGALGRPMDLVLMVQRERMVRFDALIAAQVAAMLGTLVCTWWLALRPGERREREIRTELRERNRFLSLAEQIGVIGHWRLIPAPRCELQWSDEMCRLHGVPAGSRIDGTLLNAIILPEDVARLRQMLRTAPELREPFQIEYRVRWPGGGVRTLTCRGVPTYDAAGGPTGVMGVVRDVTEEREAAVRVAEHVAELEAAAEQQAVRERQLVELAERLNTMMRIAGDGVITLDRDGLLVGFSEGASGIFGYEPAAVLGRPADILVPEELADWHRQQVRAFIKSGADSRSLGDWRTLYGLRADASRFPMSAVICRTPGERGQLAVIIRDMTEILEQERALDEARQEAVVASQAKSNFLASMSHELRTPLNSVLGFAQLLEQGLAGELAEVQREYVSYIQRGGEHLLALVNEVLDMSKVESGRLTLSLEPVEVRQALNRVTRSLSPLAVRYQVSLEIEEPMSDITVRADLGRLTQALTNLVSNAIKYNRRGGAVMIRASEAEGLCRICVSDTGIGIPERRRAELFQSFSRLGQEGGPIEGTGLGLALTKRLIELMGGSTGFRSVQDHGSQFWIDLPLADPSRQLELLEPGPPDREAQARARICARAPTLLYIEDNPVNLALLEDVLGGIPGVRLLATESGVAGIELAAAHRPDLVILDIHLPDADGFVVLERLRQRPETAGIPVVALSADAAPRDMRRALSAGFRHYLTKPFLLIELLEAVAGTLEETAAGPVSDPDQGVLPLPGVTSQGHAAGMLL
jgi:PAS domain S-box-containing protein